MFFTFGAVAQITPNEPIGNIPNPNDPEPPLDCRHDAEESWKIHPEDNKSWHICDNAAAIGYRVVVPAGVKLYTLGGDFVQSSDRSYNNEWGVTEQSYSLIGSANSLFGSHYLNNGFQGIIHQNQSGISTLHGISVAGGNNNNPILGWRNSIQDPNEETGLQIGFIDQNDNFREYISVLRNGRVGIGTTAPEAKLHVRNGDLFVTSGGISLDEGNTTITSFSTDGTLGSNSNEILPTEQAVKTYVDTRITASDDWTASSNDIFNNNSGNVGIGTANPAAKLHVQGNAIGVFHSDNSQGFTDGGAIKFGIDDQSMWLLMQRNNGLLFSRKDGTTWTQPMYLTATGNLGIGTQNPAAKLHVQGNAISVFHTDNSQGATDGGAINFGTDDQNMWHLLDRNDGLLFSRLQNNNWTQPMYLTATGKLGIGNTNPQEQLDVQGNLLARQRIMIGEISNNNDPLFLERHHVSTDENHLRINIGDDGQAHDYLSVGYYHHLDNSWHEAFSVGANGRVLVGGRKPTSNSPESASNYKLAVDGMGVFKELVIIPESGSSGNFWADYVFDKNYQLLTLDSVATYIEQHQHLPNIPSAKELTEKGLDIAEMQKLQMAKIEELTIYLIEMKKENEKLKKQVSFLHSKIK